MTGTSVDVDSHSERLFCKDNHHDMFSQISGAVRT